MQRKLVSLYRYLLWLYPSEFRQEYGESLLQLANDLSRQKHGGALLIIWFKIVLDTCQNALGEHLVRSQNIMNSRWVLITLGAMPVLILQAWDSDVFKAQTPVMLAVLVALLLPLLTAFWTAKPEILLGAGIASISTLLLIQFISPSIQGDLLTIAPLLALLLWMRWQKQPRFVV